MIFGNITRMDFNIFYLVMAVTMAFSVGCAVGLRVGRAPFHFGILRGAAFVAAVVGYLATLLFLAREAEHSSEGNVFPVVASVIIALPFLMLCVASLLAPTRKHQVSALVICVLISIIGISVNYYFFEILEDEYAQLPLALVVAAGLLAAIIQFCLVVIKRKELANETRAAS